MQLFLFVEFKSFSYIYISHIGSGTYSTLFSKYMKIKQAHRTLKMIGCAELEALS